MSKIWTRRRWRRRWRRSRTPRLPKKTTRRWPSRAWPPPTKPSRISTTRRWPGRAAPCEDIMLRKVILFGVVALVLSPVAASAQRAGRREELREKVRAFRIASIVQILDLDEQGAA